MVESQEHTQGADKVALHMLKQRGQGYQLSDEATQAAGGAASKTRSSGEARTRARRKIVTASNEKLRKEAFLA